MRCLIAQIQLLLAALDLVERRLGDVEVAALHDLRHLAEEKGQQQGQDVGAVHVGIGHDDDAVVAELGDIEVVLADAGAQGRDQGADLLGGDHLVETGLLHVEDLSLERQDRLEFPVPSLLGRAAGGITLDQVEFAQGRVLSWQSASLPGRLPISRAPLRRVSSRALRAASRARAASMDFSRIRLATWGFSSRIDGQLFVHQGFHVPLDLGVAQLGLGLPLELGLGIFTEMTRSALRAGPRRRWTP